MTPSQKIFWLHVSSAGLISLSLLLALLPIAWWAGLPVLGSLTTVGVWTVKCLAMFAAIAMAQASEKAARWQQRARRMELIKLVRRLSHEN